MIKALSSLTTICSLHSICRAGMITGGWLWMSMPGQAASWRFVVPPQDSSLSFKQLTRELTERTSLEANPNNIIFDSNYLIRTSTNRAQGGGGYIITGSLFSSAPSSSTQQAALGLSMAIHHIPPPAMER